MTRLTKLSRSISGSVAIVTGAGRGIGRGVALRLAHEGAKIVIAEFNTDSAQAVADEIIALAKAQWSADIAKDTDKAVSFLADDYTEFNPNAPTRLDGKALNMKIAEANAESSGKMVMGEMTNPKVQVAG